MYNYNSYSVSDGIDGKLMGKTLAYLVLLLGILMIGSVIGVGLGSVGLWVGFILAILSTIMVSRRVGNSGQALMWGILAAIGMGMMISTVLWYAILYQGPLLFTTVIALLLAVLVAAAVVAWIPWDFSKMGPLLFVGLIVLLVVGLLSMVIPSMGGVMMSQAYNIIGVVIFTGYLMVDFGIMRYRSRAFPEDGMAIMLAVSLLVDIVNLFLFLLRLGRR
ncbi:MAG: hypothetical protein C7B44_09590 [Sulfobacillus thermosulfidooxidans]|uniref:BAX inhibitor protein n=1 Tax=Sulfobacillus thermotolerans TaxID=338644 RepID=A0ABM6RN23_9FIRM|nr:Bax inhibitor-1 family protein [Sulfobacillus sp. hq2]AUW92716.1 hypothetical protein BXT84_01030 [Sulfobacillus thermotolerans]MCY0907693.1 Bax inhibitor-1 family protein [Sulfobacillus thermotolerans]POB12109.1 hypothetical protein CO251_01465 [Sulfobacillus sp. hq2]PSR36327.1 MAG: hypothetical protein C7B44_09590 [Sulfobacillus thermosulfidooxidans]